MCRRPANPRQAMLTEENVDAFKRLIDDMRAIAMKEHGNPMIIVQLTHSGRYSKPQGVPAPIAARHNPIYDRDRALDEACIVQEVWTPCPTNTPALSGWRTGPG